MNSFFNLEKEVLRWHIKISLGTTFAKVEKTKD